MDLQMLQWPIHKTKPDLPKIFKKTEIKIATHYYERICHSRIGKHSDRHRPDVFMSITPFMIGFFWLLIGIHTILYTFINNITKTHGNEKNDTTYLFMDCIVNCLT
jgi:hypothetical protein